MNIFQFSEFVYRRTRCSPKLSDFDKLRRYLWCRKKENNDFQNHLFVDESHVRILEVPLYHVRLPGERPEAIPCSTKIRLKINVWGGISVKGATPFAVIY